VLKRLEIMKQTLDRFIKEQDTPAATKIEASRSKTVVRTQQVYSSQRYPERSTTKKAVQKN